MTTVTKRDRPRLIQGLILKCVDGRWTDGDGLTPTGEMMVHSTTRGLQCWKDRELLDEIPEMPGEPLPDVDELNEQIPQKEWDLGLDGQPRPPWSFNWVVYLLDLEAGQRYTYLNSTSGAKIAVERLEDRLNTMLALKGPYVRPIVNLGSRVMKTRFGQKMRPDFPIIDFRDFSGDGGALLRLPGEKQTPLAIESQKTEPASAATTPVKPHGRIGPDTIKRPGKPAPRDGVGKKVKPPSVAEEINDGLPGDLAPPDNPLAAG